MLPVIESGSSQRFLIDLESKWANQPEFGFQSETRSPDSTGVARNLRLVKHDMEPRFILHKDNVRPQAIVAACELNEN